MRDSCFLIWANFELTLQCFHQYGKTEEMAITLAQTLGQNIGIFSDKKRILNGKRLYLYRVLYYSFFL